ncbi:MAG: EAL domain-containing protein [Candidatus Binatia bacterium]|nr:EAL domain-containing protein [Candidatus Binatia bacterium]
MGQPLRLLQIEDSEDDALMVSPQRVMKHLKRLKDLGLRISIDDFGIGYSPLAYLKKLPVDNVKIDRSFVMNMATDLEDCVIVRSIIALAYGLGLKVVAEGVENRQTMELLKQQGCDEGQGYFFSQPYLAAEISCRLIELREDLAEMDRLNEVDSLLIRLVPNGSFSPRRLRAAPGVVERGVGRRLRRRFTFGKQPYKHS